MHVLRGAVQHFCCQFGHHSIQTSTNIRTTGMNDKGAIRFQFDHAVSLIDIRDTRFLHDNGDAATDVPVTILRFW